MSQNIFRLKDGRLEHIGQSWLKHAFCALQFSGLCDTCDPAGFGCISELGPGCHDPYSAGLNGSQSGMGAKFEINASTGEFPWPFTGDGTSGGVLFKRIQVDNDDLDPAQNEGALYFGEGMYVAPDDAAADNDNNNASYKRISVGNFFNGGYDLDFTGSTQRGQPAIQAWQDFEDGVELVAVDVPNDGRFWVGSKVIDNGDGTYRYEYAIQNLNSHRSADELAVFLGDNVNVTDVGFKDIDYHSGEPFDNTDWSSSVSGPAVRWTSPQTFDENEFTNALRWATLYNFWFTADTPPTDGEAQLSLFRPGTPEAMTVTVPVPSAGVTPPCNPADLAEPLGVVDGADVNAFVSAFGLGQAEADLNDDGVIDGADVNTFITAFGAGCP